MEEILKQKTEEVELKKYALGIMEKTGSFEYTKKIMEEYTTRVLEEIRRLNGNKYLEAIVEALSKD